jgi:hypothetical protein
MKIFLLTLMSMAYVLLGSGCADEIVVPARTTTTVETTRVTRPVESTNTSTTVEQTRSVQY